MVNYSTIAIAHVFEFDFSKPQSELFFHFVLLRQSPHEDYVLSSGWLDPLVLLNQWR